MNLIQEKEQLCSPLQVEKNIHQSISQIEEIDSKNKLADPRNYLNGQQIYIKQCNESAIPNIIIRYKIKQYIQKFARYLPSRMFSKLTKQQYDLISDNSVVPHLPGQSLSASQLFWQDRSPMLNQKKIYPQQQHSFIDREKTERLKFYQYKLSLLFIKQKTIILTQIGNLISKIPILDPISNQRLFWDFLLLIIVLLFAFSIPIHIIYNLSYSQLLPEIFAMLMPFILIVDTILDLNTGYYDKGIQIYNRKLIFKNWFRRILPQDIISRVPLIVDIFVYDDTRRVYNDLSNTKTNNRNESSYFYQYWQIFSIILFFFNIGKILRKLNKLLEAYVIQKKYYNLINLLKLFLFLLMLGHIFSCCFLFVAQIELRDQTSNWLEARGLADDNWQMQYVNAYYFSIVTMGTVGYGDISPISPAEKIIVIIIILISNGVFGYTLNCINTIIMDFQHNEDEKIKNIFTINRYMKKKNISKGLQNQVREYIDYIMSESIEDNEDEQRILGLLSETLREKLLVEANKIVLIDSPVFKDNFSPLVIQKTVPLIREYRCSPEEVIVHSGIFNDCIYFIEKGSVELYINQNNVENLVINESILDSSRIREGKDDANATLSANRQCRNQQDEVISEAADVAESQSLAASQSYGNDIKIKKLQKESLKLSDQQQMKIRVLKVLQKGESFGAYSFFSSQQSNINIRSTEFTVLLFIRRSDFQELLQNYPEDYEKYCYIKDNLGLYDNFEFINAGCFSCSLSDHMIDKCPYMHFVPRRELLSFKFGYSSDQKRSNHFKRQHTKKKCTLKCNEKVCKDLTNFQEKNEFILDKFEVDNGLEDQIQQYENLDDDGQMDEIEYEESYIDKEKNKNDTLGSNSFSQSDSGDDLDQIQLNQQKDNGSETEDNKGSDHSSSQQGLTQDKNAKKHSLSNKLNVFTSIEEIDKETDSHHSEEDDTNQSKNYNEKMLDNKENANNNNQNKSSSNKQIIIQNEDCSVSENANFSNYCKNNNSQRQIQEESKANKCLSGSGGGRTCGNTTYQNKQKIKSVTESQSPRAGSGRENKFTNEDFFEIDCFNNRFQDQNNEKGENADFFELNFFQEDEDSAKNVEMADQKKKRVSEKEIKAQQVQQQMPQQQNQKKKLSQQKLKTQSQESQNIAIVIQQSNGLNSSTNQISSSPSSSQFNNLNIVNQHKQSIKQPQEDQKKKSSIFIKQSPLQQIRRSSKLVTPFQSIANPQQLTQQQWQNIQGQKRLSNTRSSQNNIICQYTQQPQQLVGHNFSEAVQLYQSNQQQKSPHQYNQNQIKLQIFDVENNQQRSSVPRLHRKFSSFLNQFNQGDTGKNIHFNGVQRNSNVNLANLIQQQQITQSARQSCVSLNQQLLPQLQQQQQQFQRDSILISPQLQQQTMSYIMQDFNIYDIFDQMKIFSIYFIHNNVDNVIQHFNCIQKKQNHNRILRLLGDFKANKNQNKMIKRAMKFNNTRILNTQGVCSVSTGKNQIFKRSFIINPTQRISLADFQNKESPFDQKLDDSQKMQQSINNSRVTLQQFSPRNLTQQDEQTQIKMNK